MIKWWYPSYHGVQENQLPTTTPNKVNPTNNAEQKKPYTTDYIQYHSNRLPLIAPLVRNPPAVQETLVQFLGREDPLEKG